MTLVVKERTEGRIFSFYSKYQVRYGRYPNSDKKPISDQSQGFLFEALSLILAKFVESLLHYHSVIL